MRQPLFINFILGKRFGRIDDLGQLQQRNIFNFLIGGFVHRFLVNRHSANLN